MCLIFPDHCCEVTSQSSMYLCVTVIHKMSVKATWPNSCCVASHQNTSGEEGNCQCKVFYLLQFPAWEFSYCMCSCHHLSHILHIPYPCLSISIASLVIWSPSTSLTLLTTYMQGTFICVVHIFTAAISPAGDYLWLKLLVGVCYHWLQSY